jgi:predicted NUDIX family NTP pyrophosphohydrolase
MDPFLKSDFSVAQWTSAGELGRLCLAKGMSKNAKRSAGLMMYRQRAGDVEVFLVHPGGPMWAKKDQGAWTIPKGEYDDSEEPLIAAQREFGEETGFAAMGPFLELGSVRQKSGKVVIAWAFAGEGDPAGLRSNTCEIEWPPRSGKRLEIPEVDRGAWFDFESAREYIRAEQIPLLKSLQKWIAKEASDSFA